MDKMINPRAVRIAEGAISVGAGPVQKTTNYHGYLASHLRVRNYRGALELLALTASTASLLIPGHD